MKQKSYYRYIELIFVLIVTIIFFKYRSNEISYGLPYFWNRDVNIKQKIKHSIKRKLRLNNKNY